MHNIIESKLIEIAREENIRIIHAVESGSRAWGFAEGTPLAPQPALEQME